MKNKITITVYSEQDLTPKAQSTIREIVNDGFPDHDIRFVEANNWSTKILVFGSRGPEWAAPEQKLVYTYSIAQIMTKANAATVLKSAVRQFITEPEPIPFENMRAHVAPVAIELLDPLKPTAIDIETTGNLGVEHTPEEVNLLSISFYQAGQPPIVLLGARRKTLPSNPFTPDQLNDLAAKLPQFTKAIYHNGKFDVRVLNRILGAELCVWFDTMLAHHVLNMAAGDHKLKHLAKLYLGADDWEAGINKYTKGGGYYENIPDQQLVQYNGYDVYWTYKLWELFAPQIEADENFEKAYYFEMEIAKFLLKVEKVGIPFDTKYASELGMNLEIKAEDLRNRLSNLTRKPSFNPNSPKQVKEWLEAEGHPVKSTDEKHITELMESRPPIDVYRFCKNLLAYRKATKMRGTYVVGWQKHEREGRVHPTFLVHGTSTGRLSSTGPNAQNVPRDKEIRRLVALPEGEQNGL